MTVPEVAADRIGQAIDRAGGADAIGGNRLELLIDGPATYRAMHDLIGAATRRIHCENYIFRSDGVGQRFAEALAAKAREGVRVRVLYDWLGSIATSRAQWRMLREAGAEVRAFSPPRLRDPLALINRDHRKLLSVDGSAAITGGLCIGDEWLGDPERQQAPWRDTAVLLEGPAARAADLAFAESWQAAGGEVPGADEVDPEVARRGDTAVRVVATRPGDSRAWRVLDLILGLAVERIWVTDAYLAAPARLYQVFQDAAADGVDVRLLLPGGSDIPLVRDISRTGYRRLLRSHVRIWEWGGTMLHAKTVTVDGRWARIGSSNLNPSSLVANWEIDLFVADRVLAAAMERQFAADLEGSGEVVARLSGEGRRLPGRPGLTVAGGVQARPPSGLRERRRRVVIRAAALIRAARAVLMATASALLLAAAVLLAFFPRFAAYSLAAVFAVLALILAVGSLSRRRRV